MEITDIQHEVENLLSKAGSRLSEIGKTIADVVSSVNPEILAEEKISEDEIIKGYQKTNELISQFYELKRINFPHTQHIKESINHCHKEIERIAMLYVLQKYHSPAEIAKMDDDKIKSLSSRYLKEKPKIFPFAAISGEVNYRIKNMNFIS